MSGNGEQPSESASAGDSVRSTSVPETTGDNRANESRLLPISTLALCLVLADAAVETILVGSPVRWWVAGIAAGYFGGVALVRWRMPATWARLSWSTLLTLTFACLVAVLGLTAWLPGGLEDGVRVAGQSTSTFLTLVVAAAVVVAVIPMVSITRAPTALRAAVTVAAVYSVVALGWGVVDGTSFPSLFQGDSQWRWLPGWLQGAFVGGLILIPLGFAALLALARGSQVGNRGVVVIRGLVLMLAVNLALAGSGTPGLQGTDRDLSPADDALAPTERVARGFAALEEFENFIDPSNVDVTAKARALGTDPDSAFLFVRDHVRYEPYYGVLRGAKGTLIGSAGNALDQSLLLSALLKEAGYATRIVSGVLTGDRADELVHELFNGSSVSARVDLDGEFVEKIADIAGIDANDLKSRFKERTRAAVRLEREVWDRVEDHREFIEDALDDGDVEILADTTRPGLIAEAKEHYWVQYQDAERGWVDLDPSFQSIDAGRTHGAQPQVMGAIPESLYHRLRIQSFVEIGNEASETVQSEKLVLDVGFEVADYYGQVLTVYNQPDHMPDFGHAPTQESMVAGIGAVSRFTPSLRIGGREITGKTFDLAGRESSRSLGPMGFGDLFRDATEQLDPTEAGTRVVGQRLEYTLVSPVGRAAEPRSRHYTRRIVTADPAQVDLAELRTRLHWGVEIMPVGGIVTESYLASLQILAMKRTRQAIEKLAASSGTPGLGTAGIAEIGSQQVPLNTVELAVNSAVLSEELARSHDGVRFYRDHAGLFAYETRLEGSGEGSLRVAQGFDVIENEVRVVSESDGRSARREIRRVAADLGILDTVLERVLHEQRFVNRRGSGEEFAAVSVESVFRAARDQDVDSAVLDPIGEGHARLDSLDLPVDIKAEIEAALDGGYAVIVPERPVTLLGSLRVGWWRVSRQTGHALGIIEGGRGGIVEYINSNANTSKLRWGMFRFYAGWSMCFYGLSGDMNNDAAYWGCFLAAGFGAISSAGTFSASCWVGGMIGAWLLLIA